MKAVNEVSYDFMTCPNCHEETDPHSYNLLENCDEYFLTCNCGYTFRLIMEDCVKCTTSIVIGD